MKTIVTVLGARPQFVKAATVSRQIAISGQIREVIVHTGQHYDNDMSDVFFDELTIPRPDVNLGIGGGSHGAMTGRQLEGIERLLQEVNPDWVLVYGDTNSTLAGALAAAKLHLPVAHVEAGLRSHNRGMPEEINRVATDHMSDVLFTPTAAALRNLRAEGVDDSRINPVGDVMYDASRYYRKYARRPRILDSQPNLSEDFILCTLHRAENTDDSGRLRSILAGLGEADLPVVLPLHPRTRKSIESAALMIPQNVNVCSPVSYLEMVYLESRCRIVATDSGGVQKEAYFHRKPCVTLREETEWVELVTAGVNRLVSADSSLIASSLRNFDPVFPREQLYGDGQAARKIVERLS